MIIAVICIIVVLLIIILWAVFHVCLYGCDKIGDQVIPLFEDHADTTSALLDPVLLCNKAVVMGHENEILIRIADLRSRASNATESEQIKSGTEMSSLLSRLNVAVEDYPELKANQQFLHLQVQIEDMENELQAIRRTYNAAATDYNNYIEMFPSSIIASWRKHEQQELIEFPESEIKEVKVGELFK